MVEAANVPNSNIDTTATVVAVGETSAAASDPRARQMAAMLAFGRCASARPETSILMQDAVALVADILGADFGGTGHVVAGGEELMQTVAAIDQQGDPGNRRVQQSILGLENSMAGYALDVASPITTPDVVDEQRFSDLFLRKLGVRSALTVPLHLNATPFGTLGVYCKRPRQFSSDDVGFAETIAHLVTASIGRIQAEEELREQREFASTIMELVDSMVLVLDVEGRVTKMNPVCRQVTGFAIEAVREKLFCDVFVVPEEIGNVHGVLRRAVRDREPIAIESQLLTKDGTKRRVSWSLKVTCDEENNPQSIVLSGTVLSDDAAREGAADNETGEARQQFQPVDGRVEDEQRTSPRRTYRYSQSIAPMYDRVLPSQDEFFQVTCEDISAGGISFYLAQTPEFKNLVVALGAPPKVTHFAADVVRTFEKELDGRKMHLVGCRFTGRIRL